MKPEPNDPLRDAMSAWQVKTPLPPRFQEQVWQRIALAESQQAGSWWLVVIRRVELVFARPALAASYVAILVSIGLGMGYLQADRKTAEKESQGRALYVQSVDPYQMPRNQQ